MGVRSTKTTGKGVKGLGKGLGNLIPDEDIIETEPKVVEKVVEKTVVVKEPAEVTLKLTEIEPNRAQPRKSFDQEGLQELADSIQQYGVIEPLVVAKRDGFYEIIAGERRWRASKLAGLKEVPVVIKDYSEQEKKEVALIENLQRINLNPIEEALAYQSLIDEYHMKQEEVGKKVSKSRTYITNSMRLLKLDERVQMLLIKELISSAHARTLLALEDSEEQFALATRIQNEKLSVREVEAYVKKKNSKPTAKHAKKLPTDDYIYRDCEERLKEIIGTKVVIQNKEHNRGKIEIEYYNQDDFERIMELLKK